MKQIILFGFVFSLLSANAQNLITSKLGGIYSYGNIAEKEAVGQLVIYPETDTTLLFYFESNIGPPSYSMGAVYGRVKVIGENRFFIRDTTFNCMSHFYFKKKKIIVFANPEKMDCGFGHKVFLQGNFKKISKTTPKKFVDIEGKAIYFDKTKPEEYYGK